VRLHYLHPEIAARSCDECETWQYKDDYNHKEDKIKFSYDIVRLCDIHKTKVRRPLPVRLPNGEWVVSTPCHKCPKIAEEGRGHRSTRREAIEPTPWSWGVLRHYWRCRAVGRFPLDDLVEHHAGIIDNVERIIQQAKQESTNRILNMFFDLLKDR
jgi:hypothetical protein